MEDKMIIELYFARSDEAIRETEKKYGRYCAAIARGILKNPEDAEECVSDTCLAAWNTIPPQRPILLSAYLGRICRNLSFDRYRTLSAEKRGGSEVSLVLDELSECVSGGGSAEEAVESAELQRAINAFLDTLPLRKRRLFLFRYFFACPVHEAAKKLGMSENAASVSLSRMRQSLKTHLQERGFTL